MVKFSHLNAQDVEDLKYFGYTINSKVGQGTFSRVYLASYSPDDVPPGLPSTNLRRSFSARQSNALLNVMKRPRAKLAVKVIEKSYKMPKDYPHRFLQRELNILTKLQHPYLPMLHSILRKGPKIMIFMTYAARGNLCEYMVNHSAVQERIAQRWVRQLTLALIYLHTMDIAHRDISCDNVLVTSDYNVKLSDFGYACFNVTIHGWPRYFHTHCGSMPYVAPEIIRGIPYNPKFSDIWSLGVVLFVMLNGTFPFTAHSYEQQYIDQMGKNFAFKRQLVQTLTQSAKDKVKRMLEPNPLLRLSLQEIMESKWLRKLNENTPKHIKEREQRAQQKAEETKEAMKNISHKKDSIQYPTIKIEKETYFERMSNLMKRHSMKGKEEDLEDEIHYHYRNSR